MTAELRPYQKGLVASIAAEWTDRQNRNLTQAAHEAPLALNGIGYPMSEAAWSNVGDYAAKGPTASVESRRMHRAATALEAALAGEIGK